MDASQEDPYDLVIIASLIEREVNKDEYRDKLIELIEEKVKRGGKELPTAKTKPKAATNVVDLVAVLQKSLAETKKKASANGSSKASHAHRKKHKKELKKAA